MKMAVALRTNKWKVKWNANSNLVLHNPLKVNRLCNDADSDMIDDIFIMSIKSMITKVFTVVGSYDLFQRPVKDSRQTMSMPNNPLRQIMGGSDVNPAFTTRVNPKATELYIRLPLLAEWYKKVFDLNQTA